MPLQALAPYATSFTGIDLSASMAAEYNTAAQNQGIPPSEMHAHVGNLIDSHTTPPVSFSGPEFHEFDLAVVGLGFHHFEEPALATRRLAERLKEGGVLCVIDFLPHAHVGGSGSGHGHKHEHNHGHVHRDERRDGDLDKGERDDSREDGAAHTVKHMGFSEAQIRTMFEEAGVGRGFSYVTVGKGVVFGPEESKMERSVFMARGEKA